jgi:8-oxo-dGTP pyrophosphatase MutT (NUDIX family)/predicted nucleotidyltransferase
MRAREFIVEYKTEEYNGLRFTTDIKNGQLIVRALDDWGTNELGHVVFNIGDQDELDPQDLEVDDRYQGQGIAKTMYDYVKTLGYEIHRSYDQTPAGAGFWNKHRGKDERVWEDAQPKKQVVSAIQKVLPVAQEIWFHGSRATGKHRRNSDTDILVVVPDDLVGDQYLAVVRILQKLSSLFDNYDIQPTKSGTNIHRIAQEEGQLLWPNHLALAEDRGQGAAGIVLYAEDTGRYGLQQRSDDINDPGMWAAWGGGREPGETLEQCARRELAEESGYTGPIKLHHLASNPKYTTFIGVVPHEFEPQANDEWKNYCWTEAGDWPSPMHPGVTAALKNIPIDEGVKSRLAQAALAGGLALGAGGANAMDWKDAAMTGAMFVPGVGQAVKAYNVGSNLWQAAKAAKQLYDINKDTQVAQKTPSTQQTVATAQPGEYNDKMDPVDENFADGKVKGKSRPGRVARAGASCNGSVTDLRARAKNASGEKARMYHWCANMKSGKKK